MSESDYTAALLRDIKRELRGMMNGPVSASMRAAGLAYKVNFGVELPRLLAYARELPHTYELAAALWKENIRECRLLAGMLMPVERFEEDLAEVWIDQMLFTEEAEMTVMTLFSHAPWASGKAFEWIASPDDMHQLCGFLLMARLFMQGMSPSERDACEFLDQAQSAIDGGSSAVRRAAANAVAKYELLAEDGNSDASQTTGL